MSGLRWIALSLAAGLIGCGGPDAANQAETAPAAPETASAAPMDTANANAAVSGAAPARAVATLRTAQGADAGTATATFSGAGVMLALNVQGLPPGQHGAHVHLTGRCDAPTFESAGGHWNPTERQHGLENPQGRHAGDLPNLTVDANGRGALDYTLEGATLAGLLDADGAAMMIHAAADDQRTDPSGNSGGRIACGVFAPA